MSGSALDLTSADASAEAILQTWYPGARGGKEIAKILFGKEQPSGKLPVTFYKDIDHMPEFTDYTMKGRTYRFIEEAPLYPFGYGLSYGDATITDAAIKNDFSIYSKLEECQLEVTIKNNKSYPCQELKLLFSGWLS